MSLRLGIRSRLLAPLGVLLVGVAGGGLWAALAHARAVEARVARQLGRVADTLAAGSYPLTPPVLEQMKGLSGAEFRLDRADGVAVSTLPPDAVVRSLQLAGDSLGPTVVLSGVSYRTRGISLRGGDATRSGQLTILYPEERLQADIADAFDPVMLLAWVGVLSAVVMALATGTRLTRRVRALERHTRRIAEGDFRPEPLPAAFDELRTLSASVNAMAERLGRMREAVAAGERMRLLGEVSGGLAHQLRNAVAGARLALQVHADECRDCDPEPLGVALRELALMESHLRRFFDLGQEAGRRSDPIDLAAVLRGALELIAPRLRHARIELSVAGEGGPLPLAGDADQLGHLLLNLLTNAADAAGPGGRVAVAAHQDSAGYTIDVTDSGPGPPPAVAASLFEPFVTGKPGGVGLGLAVARRAAEAHGGSLVWDRDAGATRFRLRLPVTG